DDRTKGGVVGLSSFAGVDQADMLITDAGIDSAVRDQLASTARRLIVVDVASPAELRAADDPPAFSRDRGKERLTSVTTSREPAVTHRHGADGTVPGVLDQPHRRYNPLSDEWLLVSAGRTRRPWLGREEQRPPEHLPSYDPACYLCPGNVRASGARNPDYASTYVFTNDFPALQPNGSTDRMADGLLMAEGAQGTCRVVCFSPRHDLTLAQMRLADVRRVVDVWAAESAALGERYRW